MNDNYLHSSTSINTGGTTVINFTIANIPASSAADRFSIVFTPPRTLPVTFSFIKAYFKSTDVNLEWKAENESIMKEYDIERYTNGNDYTTIHTVTANNKVSVDYNWLDVHPTKGYNYYRIQSTDVNGKTDYSTVAKIFTGKEEQNISMYPNPISNGIINMQMNNAPGGIYEIQLLDKIGREIISESVRHSEDNSRETITTRKLAKRTYLLIVTNPDHTKTSTNIIY